MDLSVRRTKIHQTGIFAVSFLLFFAGASQRVLGDPGRAKTSYPDSAAEFVSRNFGISADMAEFAISLAPDPEAFRREISGLADQDGLPAETRKFELTGLFGSIRGGAEGRLGAIAAGELADFEVEAKHGKSNTQHLLAVGNKLKTGAVTFGIPWAQTSYQSVRTAYDQINEKEKHASRSERKKALADVWKIAKQLTSSISEAPTISLDKSASGLPRIRETNLSQTGLTPAFAAQEDPVPAADAKPAIEELPRSEETLAGRALETYLTLLEKSPQVQSLMRDLANRNGQVVVIARHRDNGIVLTQNGFSAAVAINTHGYAEWVVMDIGPRSGELRRTTHESVFADVRAHADAIKENLANAMPQPQSTATVHRWIAAVKSLKNTNPESVARGAAIGAAIALNPFPGIHTLAVFLLCKIFRGNVAASIFTSFIHNPVTSIPIIALDFAVGRRLIPFAAPFSVETVSVIGRAFLNSFSAGIHALGALGTGLLAAAIGSLLLTFVAAPAVYFVTKFLMKRARRTNSANIDEAPGGA